MCFLLCCSALAHETRVMRTWLISEAEICRLYVWNFDATRQQEVVCWLVTTLSSPSQGLELVHAVHVLTNYETSCLLACESAGSGDSVTSQTAWEKIKSMIEEQVSTQALQAGEEESKVARCVEHEGNENLWGG